jgi:hypothetical protein
LKPQWEILIGHEVGLGRMIDPIDDEMVDGIRPAGLIVGRHVEDGGQLGDAVDPHICYMHEVVGI